ncbi:hypothetical protein TNCV_4606211 [Trichonephila clavipes]|nr:hypothetical protein TNCV_4606211 [Trichonephila clavipes]
MTSHNRLEYSLEWRAVGRTEAFILSNAGSSIVTSGPKVVIRKKNKFQTSGTVTRKFGHGCHRASTSAKNCYLVVSTRRHRRTLARHLARDFAAGIIISRQTVYSLLAETALYSQHPVW